MRTFERKSERRSGGFTLIEMLVVIVIIVILMGVVFRLSRGAMAKSDYAAEEKRVSILRTLIEEFHAEYNLYPPVPVYTYKSYNGTKNLRVQPVNFVGAYGNARDVNFFPTDKGYSPTCEKHYFVFGLMSHFVDRGHFCNKALSHFGSNSDPVKDWGGCNDSPKLENGKLEADIPAKDKAFVKRVAPIVAQILDYSREEYEKNKTFVFDRHIYVDADNGHCKGFTTELYDSWGHEYVYVSSPPYTTYLVFSAGPDGKYDPDYPGDRSKDANKDNIYGNLGDN